MNCHELSSPSVVSPMGFTKESNTDTSRFQSANPQVPVEAKKGGCTNGLCSL